MLFALSTTAGDTEETPEWARPVEDVPGLPRVLLVGDSISIGYHIPTRELLAGKANVHRPPVNCGPTSRGLKMIDEWLGDGNWDVIHFNFGLHDLKYMEDGSHQVPVEQYAQNLRVIATKMLSTGAEVIWCNTTPVPDPVDGPFRRPEDVVNYNEAAASVMAELNIPTNDLYGFALERLEDIQRPHNVHFTDEGSAVLAERVAEVIAAALSDNQ
ncbi:MAG: SGNH/GDSL hydrolase family protein [Armatimonadetes bacterium]|nr:SGNH/GDSL hydrolase family protein [Armatimonadota bacterium]